MTVTFQPTNYLLSPLARTIRLANAIFDELQLAPDRTTVISTETVEDDGDYGSTIAVVDHSRVQAQSSEGPLSVLPQGHRAPRNENSEMRIRFDRHPASKLVQEFSMDGVLYVPILAEEALNRVALAAAMRSATGYEFSANDFIIPIPHPIDAGRWVATFVGAHPYYVGSFVFAGGELPIIEA